MTERTERDTLRRRARRVHAQAILLAVLGSGLALGLRAAGVLPR